MQSVYVIIRAHTVKAHLSWLKQNNPPASYALLLVYLSELVLWPFISVKQLFVLAHINRAVCGNAERKDFNPKHNLSFGLILPRTCDSPTNA